MKTVLIAWELGGGLGHVMRAAAFADEFVRQGARVAVALRDPSSHSLAQWPQNVVFLQAPWPNRVPRRFAYHASYGELLYGCGYHDRNQINALVVEWRRLMQRIDPDILMADHAPTAHLAARLNGIPLTRVGTGFFAPPPLSPTPRFRTWHDIDEKRMLAAEAHVLQVINSIMAAGNIVPETSLSKALAPDIDMIAGWPELDCYATLRPPESATYIGNERSRRQSAPPLRLQSVPAGRKKIFAYLKGDYSAIEPVLRALQKEYATFAFVTLLDKETRQNLANEHLYLAEEPIDCVAAAQLCDMLICHGGAGTAPLFLEAGKPVLLLPYQAEQRLNSEKIAATGAGTFLDENSAQQSFERHLAQFIADPRYAAAAQILARRWSGKEDAVVTGATHVLQWLEQAPPRIMHTPLPENTGLPQSQRQRNVSPPHQKYKIPPQTR